MFLRTINSDKNLPEQLQIHEFHTQGQRKCHQPKHFQTLIPPATSVLIIKNMKNEVNAQAIIYNLV